ncbi:single-stranded DNA-binding protein [Agromyces salentinus]|uniref:Single-stranded DNA-binding protein n=1 Tax=Agromyces salentinus TaxID=269421 RepID=A0ABP4YW70_9MICO|nr:single-stranded DNA-binding protein [Agromyces salentinus]
MTDNITVIGVVGGDPRVHVTNQGLPITSFRLASTRRFFDRAKGTWENGETNWYTVSAFRQLAKNAAVSVRRGDRVVVHGRLRLRAWESGERNGTAIEIEADSVGHDLSWGTTSLTKNSGGATESPAEAATGLPSAEGVPTGWATPLGVDDDGREGSPERSDVVDESGDEGLDADAAEDGAEAGLEHAHVPF